MHVCIGVYTCMCHAFEDEYMRLQHAYMSARSHTVSCHKLPNIIHVYLYSNRVRSSKVAISTTCIICWARR